MESRKFYKDLIFYLAIILIVLILLGVSFWMVYFYTNLDSTIIAGLLGLFGSILGGAITFIGVKVTLNNQNKERFISDFPSKVNALQIIEDKLGNFAVNFIEIERSEALNLLNISINESARVNGKLYSKLIELKKSYIILRARADDQRYNFVEKNEASGEIEKTDETILYRSQFSEKFEHEREVLIDFVMEIKAELKIKYSELNDY